MANIAGINARPILNSRGEWTIEVGILSDDNNLYMASVPNGKSVGKNEAVSINAFDAVENMALLDQELRGYDLSDQASIDARMVELDNSPDKSQLGANTMLAVSLAAARGGAASNEMFLWQYIAATLGTELQSFPSLVVNVINGGLHAGNGLSFQEYQYLVSGDRPSDMIDTALELYVALGERLRERINAAAINVGDEGGYAPNFEDDIEPLRVMAAVATENAADLKVGLGLDVAASNLEAPKEDLRETYNDILSEFKLAYLEDPFNEDDQGAFREMTETFGDDTLIVGDDLTTTNSVVIERLGSNGTVNSVIIKPNQIGTLTETFEAIDAANQVGIATVISHRSGETNDTFIADLAVGAGTWGFKLGAPARGERVAKYNRLLAIEAEAGF